MTSRSKVSVSQRKALCFGKDVTKNTKNDLPGIANPVDSGNLEKEGQNK